MIIGEVTTNAIILGTIGDNGCIEGYERSFFSGSKIHGSEFVLSIGCDWIVEPILQATGLFESRMSFGIIAVHRSDAWLSIGTGEMAGRSFCWINLSSFEISRFDTSDAAFFTKWNLRVPDGNGSNRILMSVPFQPAP